MKLKPAHWILLLPVLAFSFFVHYPASPYPTAKITVLVLGDDGRPISGARVTIVFASSGHHNDLPIHGYTGSDGQYTDEGPCDRDISARVEKEGFYATSTKSFGFTGVAWHRWQPWNPTLTATLDKIGIPRPLYVRHLRTELPQTDQAVGFDLIVGDWVSPFGAGQATDISFTLTRSYTNSFDYDCHLKLDFGDSSNGFVPWYDDMRHGYRELKMPRMAPDSGYTSVTEFRNMREPGGPIRPGTVTNRNYYFRIRGRTDTDGKLVGAHYGKIVGDIHFSPSQSATAGLSFIYYVSPTPMDTNLEFDVHHTLVPRNQRDSEEFRP